jgi:hypothetical protein
VTITIQALSLVEKADPVKGRVTLRLRDQWSMWMQDGCKVYMDPYMATNASCSMVTWIKFKNRLLEVGLTQNWETMVFWNLTTVYLFYFIMCEDPAWIESYWNSIWLRAQLHMTSHYTWGAHDLIYMILEVSWTLSFGLSQFHGHGSWLVCEVALTYVYWLIRANS